MRPDFLGIGVPKAGTTSLHHYLAQHPQVLMSQTKEPHYFLHSEGQRRYTGPGDEASTENDVYDLASYEALFEHDEGQIAGEISPQYLGDPEVPRRVQGLLPDARFIALLRDPTDRAYSNYLHMRRREREPYSFEKALQKEPERLTAGWEPFWGYRHQSMYHENFQPWLKVFPKDRFLVLTLKQLKNDPAGTMDRVHEFLGVGPFQAEHLVYNPGGVGRSKALHRRLLGKSPLGGLTAHVLPKRLRLRLHLAARRWNAKYPPIKPKTDAQLRHGFLPEIEGIERTFGMDLDFWKHPDDR